jgi:hypothetical protein
MCPIVSRWLALLLLLATAAAQASGSAVKPSPPPEDENSRKARALIDQTIEALGGQAYLTYQEKTEDGRFYTFFHGESNSAGTPYGFLAKYPDKDRLEIIHLRSYHILWWTVGNVPIKDKHDIVVIHSGDKGYEITYKGTRALDAKELSDYLRRRRFSLERVLREWLAEPGVALFYEGPTVAEQKAVEQVTITNSRNETVTLFLDANTHLPVKKTFSWRDPTDKQRNVEDEVYDNYRVVRGIMTPFSVTRYYNGDMAHQRFVNTVTYNSGLSDSLFEASVNYQPDRPPPKK